MEIYENLALCDHQVNKDIENCFESEINGEDKDYDYVPSETDDSTDMRETNGNIEFENFGTESSLDPDEVNAAVAEVFPEHNKENAG